MILVDQLRKCFAALLAAAVVFAFGYHELHYIFTHHQAKEHCENHLHGAEESHCDFCIIDISVVSEQAISAATEIENIFVALNLHVPVVAYNSSEEYLPFLRGPPVAV